MNHLSALFVALLIGATSFAQLPNGSVAPDFTLYDINGVTHNLYDILDEGKAVILQFSATWSAPCWSYHTSGVLEDLYEEYGPNGTDELRIFFIESDDSTTDVQLNGGDGSQGDWVAATSYPIIDYAESLSNIYENSFYPTIYTVCPNRILTQSGQVSAAEHLFILQSDNCSQLGCHNPLACNYSASTINGDLIYAEDFESFVPNDYIASDADWTTWSGSGYGTAEDAQISSEEAFDGSNSLHVYGADSLNGGPMDVVLTIGADDGILDASFWMYIPSGFSAYYNVQEDIFPGVGWAFDVTFASIGWFQVTADAAVVGSGTFPVGEWFKIDHHVDMDNNLISLSIDGVTVNDFPFDSAFGGVNFYGWGDGSSFGSYYIDNLSFFAGETCAYPGCQDALASNYDSSAGCYGECIYAGCADSSACNYNPTVNEDDGSCNYFSCVNCSAATDIFISEYCEGSGYNTGVEFYNPTSETIDLSNYQLMRHQNGTEIATDSIELVGSISPQSTHVLINGTIDEIDGWPAVDSAMLAYADQLGNTYPAPTFFNGNDALVLIKNGGTVVDIFGVIGQDPGLGWTNDSLNGFEDAGEGEVVLTRNHTLRRKPEVLAGVTDNPVVFNTLLEWDVFEVDDWSGLGWHIMSCEEEYAGCTETSACNFEPDALVEDNTLCVFPGCQDSDALNFDTEAGCPGECNYLTYDCLSIGDESWADESVGLYPEMQQAMHGVPWSGEWIFNIPASLIEPQSGVSYGVDHIEWTSVDGLPAWVENLDYSLGELIASSQHCIAAEGTPSDLAMHTVSVSGEAFISFFNQPVSIGEVTYTATISVLENPDPILGCTYGNAVNYLAYANADNGTCIYPGCMDSTAGNYNPYATEEDGSCCDDCDVNTDSNCASDTDGDGAVTISDLLILLSEFGISCE